MDGTTALRVGRPAADGGSLRNGLLVKKNGANTRGPKPVHLHVPVLSLPGVLAGQRGLQTGVGVPCSSCPAEESPEPGHGLRWADVARCGPREAREVRPGGGRSRGQNQPGGQLHH